MNSEPFIVYIFNRQAGAFEPFFPVKTFIYICQQASQTSCDKKIQNTNWIGTTITDTACVCLFFCIGFFRITHGGLMLFKLFTRLIILGFIFTVCSAFSQSQTYLGAYGGLLPHFHSLNMGWNNDSSCGESQSNCPSEGKLKGYAWTYTIDQKHSLNPVLGFQAGWRKNNIRLEAVVHRATVVKTKHNFKGLYYLKEEGRPYSEESFLGHLIGRASLKDLTQNLIPAKSNPNILSSDFKNSADKFQIWSGFLTVYYEYPIDKITAYAGLGLGWSWIKHRIYYESKEDKQDAEFKDNVFSQQLSAGLDYAISEHLSIGLQVFYVLLAEAKDTLPYEKHSQLVEENHIIDRNLNYLTAVMSLKYYLPQLN